MKEDKPYFRCAVHPELRFNRHMIDPYIHALEWHAPELEKRSPNVRRQWKRSVDSLFEQTDV